MTPDRPLSDTQERVLIALAIRPDEWWRPRECRSAVTLYALAGRGLVQTSETRMFRVVAKITDAGLAMLATMGD